jgi:hypothetical protein
VFVVQWKNVTRSPQGSTADNYTFQIRLNEATGRADVVYGTMSITAAVGAQIGASAVNADMITLATRYSVTDWMRPRLNSGKESIALANWGPASGTTYTFGAATTTDVGITGLASPSGKFNANTNQTVQVVLRNNGTTALDSVEVRWAVNGIDRTTIRVYPSPKLQKGETFTVNLGTVNFTAGSFNTITAWTDKPNGAQDLFSGNDGLLAYLAPRTQGNVNVATTANPGVFSSFRDGIRYLEVAGISGNVTLQAFNGSYNEQLIIPPIDNTVNGGTVTIAKAANNTATITWQPSNNPNAVYGAYESDFAQVTLLPNAAVRITNMVFTLPNGVNTGGNIYGYSLGAVEIDRCTFNGPNNYLTMSNPKYSVSVDGGPINIRENSFSNLPYGIYANGTTGSQDKITDNTMSNYYSGGIFCNSNNVLVTGNTLTGASGANTSYGIGVQGAGTVSANRVSSDVSSQAASSARGIEATSNYGNVNGPHGLLMANNMVGVSASGTAIGLVCSPDAGSAVTKVIHNTVHVTATAGVGNSVAGYFPGNTKIQIINNIFSNPGSGSNGGYAVYIEEPGVGVILDVMDFNDLYTTGTYVGYFHGNIIRNTTGNPLTAWRTATGKDQNSSAIAPVFVGGQDLHLKNMLAGLYGSAATIATVGTDIDGETRVKPYMGADELKPQVKILEHPVSRYACFSETFQLICVADVTPGATVTYQWYRDGVKLNGRTGSVLVVTNAGYSASGAYTCEVQGSDGTVTTAVQSDPATVIVVRPTNIVVQPVSQPVALETTVTLEVEAEAIGAPDDFVPTYQWKKHFWNGTAYQDTNVLDNNRITGSKSNRLTIHEVGSKDTTDTYLCTVTGYCGTVNTRAVRLFIPIVSASTSTPTACIGGMVNIECLALPGAAAGSTVRYQWYHEQAMLSNGPNVTGAKDKALRITNATQADAGTYTCVVTYDDVEITSNTVQVVMGTSPTIATQPKGDTVCEGGTITLSVVGNGEALSYRWFKGTSELIGATNATLVIQNANAVHVGTYNVLVANPCGGIVSQVADIGIKTAPTVTKQPTDVNKFDGDTIKLSVEASGAGPITYQWLRNDTVLVGATEQTLLIASAKGSDKGVYKCIVSNECGSDTSRTANVLITVGVSSEVLARDGYVLGTAVPNPAADNVTFNYTLPTAEHVTLSLSNSVGQHVAVLFEGISDAGEHTFRFSALDLHLAPGVYNFTIVAGRFAAVQQVIIVR